MCFLFSHFFFFFSSRRRHTRYIGDWSSDVCSSDHAVVVLGQHQRRLHFQHGVEPFENLRLGQVDLVEIGRASGRERVEISGGAANLKKKKKSNQDTLAERGVNIDVNRKTVEREKYK